MLVGVALVAACVYYQNHPPQLKGWTGEKLRALEAKPAAPDQAPVTTIVSPLEVLMGSGQPRPRPLNQKAKKSRRGRGSHIPATTLLRHR